MYIADHVCERRILTLSNMRCLCARVCAQRLNGDWRYHLQ